MRKRENMMRHCHNNISSSHANMTACFCLWFLFEDYHPCAQTTKRDRETTIRERDNNIAPSHCTFAISHRVFAFSWSRCVENETKKSVKAWCENAKQRYGVAKVRCEGTILISRPRIVLSPPRIVPGFIGSENNAGLFREDPGHHRSSSGMIRLAIVKPPGETVVNRHGLCPRWRYGVFPVWPRFVTEESRRSPTRAGRTTVWHCSSRWMPVK
jgi:hypothetical protein